MKPLPLPIDRIFKSEPLVSPRLKKWLLASLGLHVVVSFLAIVDLPNFFRTPKPERISVPVEVVTRQVAQGQQDAPVTEQPEAPEPSPQPTAVPPTEAPTSAPEPEPQPTAPPPTSIPPTPKPDPDDARRRTPEQRTKPPTQPPTQTATPRPTEPPRPTSPPTRTPTSTAIPPTATPQHPAIAPPEERTQLTTQGSVAGATTAGSVAFEEDFHYDYYVSALISKTGKNWMPRPGYMPSGTQYTAIVSFTLLKNGTVINPRVTQSSGKPQIDQSALRAVQLSSPYPELPPGYGANQVNVHLAFYLEK